MGTVKRWQPGCHLFTVPIRNPSLAGTRDSMGQIRDIPGKSGTGGNPTVLFSVLLLNCQNIKTTTMTYSTMKMPVDSIVLQPDWATFVHCWYLQRNSPAISTLTSTYKDTDCKNGFQYNYWHQSATWLVSCIHIQINKSYLICAMIAQ